MIATLLSLSATLPVLAQQAADASQPAAEEISVSLALSGPSGCGSEADLSSRIAWRTSRVRIVPIGSSERHLDVTLELTDNAATATLSLTLPNGRRATRVLRAATCDEAVDAAALVAAVTLDPTASIAPTTPPVADAGVGDASDAGGTGGAGPAPTSTSRPPEVQGGTAGSDTASRSALSGSVFVPVELIAGPAPSPLYGLGAGVMGVWERGSIISPAARLSYVHFFGQEFQQIGGTAYFSLDIFNLDLCPFRVGNEIVGFFACASFAFGLLEAEGRQTNDARAETLDWLVPGGTLLLELRPVQPLEVQLFGTLGPPLERNSFQFGCPSDTGPPNGVTAADCEPNLFHEVPALSARGGIALGVFFR